MREKGRSGGGSRINVSAIAMGSAITAGFFSLTGSLAAADPCKLEVVSALTAYFNRGATVVDVQVNGTPVKMVLESGASMSWVSKTSATRLGLALDRNAHVMALSNSGTSSPDIVVIPELKIGQLVAHAGRFSTIAEGGDGTIDEPIGQLSQNYLAQFDIELDPAANRVNLFSPIRCPEAAYWSNEHFELPLVQDEFRRPVVHVTIDGQELRALVDTGASRSSVNILTAQKKLNVPDSIDVPLPTLTPADHNSKTPALYTFNELVFGPITIKHPKMMLDRTRALDVNTGTHIKSTVDNDAPVTIGMDILGKFHSLISYQKQTIYFTLPNERLGAVGVPPKP